MAIQEIESKEVQTRNAVSRGIDESAIGLMMDIVQSTQYQYPIESCVREITANAVDSVTERNRAIDILSGKSKVSDFFIERSEALYKDSKWDPSYYNTDYFSDNNSVTITYKEREGVGRCNSLIIKDEGVGLGLGRLFGVLGVGWSTKRLRKDTMGSFGLGSKSGLATGADYYTIRTAHNGVRYEIRVYNRKYQSMIGPVNLNTGEANIANVKGEEIIYGEPYEGSNFTEFEVPVLKTTRQQYIEACKKQLLYMKDIELYVDHTDNSRQKIDFLAPAFYNSANIILSDNNYYSKPHVVVVKGDMESDTGMCYGFLDFDEMESTPITGNIGIKCPIRQVTRDEDGEEVEINPGVDVTPSREAIRYTPQTIAFINSQFAKAKDEATVIVEESLKSTDLIEWISACRSVTSMSDSNKVLARLKKICDLDEVNPTFKGKSLHSIKFSSVASIFFAGFKVLLHSNKKVDGRRQVERATFPSWSYIDFDKIYHKDAETDRVKELYLLDTVGEFITISFTDEITAEDLGLKSERSYAKTKDKIDAAYLQRDAVWELLNKKSYKDVVVPEDWSEEVKEKEIEYVRELTPEEKRKRDGQTVFRCLKAHQSPNYENKSFSYDKSEPYVSDLADYKGKLYYCTEQEEALLHYVGHFVDRRSNGTNSRWSCNSDQITLALVAKNNLKHFKHGIPLQDFLTKKTLLTNTEGKLTGGYKLEPDMNVVQWNTARHLKPVLDTIPFMRNFSIFNEEMFKLYTQLSSYVTAHYSDITGYCNRYGVAEYHEGFVALLDKAQIVQDMVREGATIEEINERVSPGEPNGLADAFVVEQPMLDKLETLMSYANNYKDMLNHHYILCDAKYSITNEVERSVKEYLQLKQ